AGGPGAANVRRVGAITGRVAIDWFRERSDALVEAGTLLGSPRDPMLAARRAAERLRELERRAEDAERREVGEEAEELAAGAAEIGGVKVVTAEHHGADQRALLMLADRVKSRLGEAAVVRGGTDDGRVALGASFTGGVEAGAARGGWAISGPTGTSARPLNVIEPPDPQAVAELAVEHEVELVVVWLPVSLSGSEGPQASEARAFKDALARILDVPVE